MAECICSFSQGLRILGEIRDRDPDRERESRIIDHDQDHDEPHALAVDSDENIYVMGQSCPTRRQTADEDDCRPSGYNIATVKYSPSGSQQWVARLGYPNIPEDQPGCRQVVAAQKVIGIGAVVGDRGAGHLVFQPGFSY